VFGAGDQNSALAGREPYHAVATAKTGRDGVPPPSSAGGDNGGKGGKTEHSARIVALMRKNPKISVSAIVSAIGGGKRSVEREIGALKKAGKIDRKGTYAGEWIVVSASPCEN